MTRGRRYVVLLVAWLVAPRLWAAPPAPPAPRAFPATTLWTVTRAAGVTAAPAVAADHLILPLSSGEIVGLSLQDGSQRWSVPLRADTAVTAVAADVLLTDGARLTALDAASGVTHWQATLEARAVVPIAVAADAVFVLTAAPAVESRRVTDGSLIWRRALAARPIAAAAASDARLFVPTADGVMALDRTTGQVVWQRALGGPPTTVGTARGLVLAGSADNYLYALDGRTGRIQWQWRTGADIVAGLIVSDRQVIFASLDNVVRTLSLPHGALRWAAPAPVRPVYGVAALDRAVVASGIGGTSAAVSLADGSALGVVTVVGDLTAPPVTFTRQATTGVILVSQQASGELTVTALMPTSRP